MTTDRKIVLMLILRARSAHRRMRRRLDKNDVHSYRLCAEWAEAHNAAELARRILYNK